MQMIRSHITVLFFCLGLAGTGLFGAAPYPSKDSRQTEPEIPLREAPSAGREGRCSCGCACEFECSCGCCTGAACGCSRTSEAPQECQEADCRCCCRKIVFGESYFQALEQEYNDGIQPDPLHPVYELEYCPCLRGVWFPEDPPLFRPFMASPRQVTYSAGWRFNDSVLVKNVIPVSYGDTIAFYRWLDVWPWGGQLQIELEGALWAVFDPLHNSSPLIDADYYVGIPITYAIGRLSFRLCGYHISTHIGDEFLLDHPGFHRRNPSAEFLDFFVSWYITDDIRLYGGVGVVVDQDESFRQGRLYSEAGMEVRLFELGFVDYCNQLYGTPIFGMDFRVQTRQDKHINQTYILGYEIGKLIGTQRRVRAFMEYHDGYSVDGQFQKFPTNYFALRITYGY